MLKAAILYGTTRFTINFFGSCLHRNFTSYPNNLGIPGGGLQKLQGGIREETFFNSQDLELITKIREQGSKLKCKDCLGNWDEFEKVLGASNNTCSLSKHKNCLEEAFFLNEQNDCVKLLQYKLKNEKQTKFP